MKLVIIIVVVFVFAIVLFMLSRQRIANISEDASQEAKDSSREELYAAMHPKPKTPQEIEDENIDNQRK